MKVIVIKNTFIFFVVIIGMFCFPLLSVNASDSSDDAMCLVGSSIKNGDTHVYSETKEILLEFSDEVGMISGILVKKNGSNVTYQKEIVDSRFVKITLTSELGYDATYTIDLTTVGGINGQNCTEVISFTTEKTPDITIVECEESNALDVFGANLTLYNNTDKEQKAYITVMILGENGVAKDISELVISLAPDAETDFQTGYYCNTSWGRCSVQIMLRNENEMPIWRTIVLRDE